MSEELKPRPYYDDYGSDKQKIGRKIYQEALARRRGFRDDHIGIDSDDDIWLEIFQDIGEQAIKNNRPAGIHLTVAELEAMRSDKTKWNDNFMEQCKAGGRNALIDELIERAG